MGALRGISKFIDTINEYLGPVFYCLDRLPLWLSL